MRCLLTWEEEPNPSGVTEMTPSCKCVYQRCRSYDRDRESSADLLPLLELSTFTATRGIGVTQSFNESKLPSAVFRTCFKNLAGGDVACCSTNTVYAENSAMRTVVGN